MEEQGVTSSGDEYHSPDEKEDAWVHEREIGVGGFGVVKLFANKTTGERIVLKECRSMNLSREFMERWHGELQIIKRLNHKNIVRALEVPSGLLYQPMGNAPFICMEFCDRGDLRQILRRPEHCCGLPEEQIRQLCSEVNAGIRFLHSEKVIHRDLKPENILIKQIDAKNVVYKLTDFGYSKSYDQNSVCTSLVGTMQYVAPEVIKSRRYNSSVDFWSFGVVVFECICGLRPFLHGCPANNIAWIDFVVRKQPDVIHIYFSKDGVNSISSSHLPKPHQLSEIFESLLASWLQMALHYNPEMRGGRRKVNEDAPCLSNMDHILSTKVVTTVCMSTGEVYSFNVEQTTTYNDLKHFTHCSSSVPPQHQFQILPSGHMPEGTDSVVQDMHGNTGRVFIFTTTLEPSFKMMHTSNDAVSSLTAYGDSKISPHDMREVYARVFFHIREYYMFFQRLQEGHWAMLYQLSQHCKAVETQEKVLSDSYLVTQHLLSVVKNMYSKNCGTLGNLLGQNKVHQSFSNYFASWENSLSFLKEREEELEVMSRELAALHEETNSYLRMSDDLQTNYDICQSRLEDYKQNYVAASCQIYQSLKTDQEAVQGNMMQDVLLGATQEAHSFIEESLNGYNFGQTFVTISSHLRSIDAKMQRLNQLKMDLVQMDDMQRNSLWDIIVESNSLSAPPSVPDSVGALNMSTPESSIGQVSAEVLRRQFSGASASSIDSVSDPKLVQSIYKMHRLVSEEDNTRAIDRSKELRSKFQTLSRSSSTIETNGKHPIRESGTQ